MHGRKMFRRTSMFLVTLIASYTRQCPNLARTPLHSTGPLQLAPCGHDSQSHVVGFSLENPGQPLSQSSTRYSSVGSQSLAVVHVGVGRDQSCSPLVVVRTCARSTSSVGTSEGISTPGTRRRESEGMLVCEDHASLVVLSSGNLGSVVYSTWYKCLVVTVVSGGSQVSMMEPLLFLRN